MFYHVKKLKKNLVVDPKDYGPGLNETIKRKLITEVMPYPGISTFSSKRFSHFLSQLRPIDYDCDSHPHVDSRVRAHALQRVSTISSVGLPVQLLVCCEA